MQFIGSDLILTGAMDETMGFTDVSSDARPIARLQAKSRVADTAVTVDGRIAFAASKGTSVWAPPQAVADAGKEHAKARVGDNPTPGGDLDANGGVDAEVVRAFEAIPRGELADAPMDGAVLALRDLFERVGGAAHLVDADDAADALESAGGGDGLRASPVAFRAAFFALAAARGVTLPAALPPAFRDGFIDAAAPETMLGSRAAARVLIKVWNEVRVDSQGEEAAAAPAADAGSEAAVAGSVPAATTELDMKEVRAMLQDFCDENDKLAVSAFEKGASRVLYGEPPMSKEL